MPETSTSPLRILHAVRAPVGGIFRHILDLAVGQAERGHEVGILADSLTGGERAEAALKEIAPKLKLGVYRLAIRREPHPIDGVTALHFLRLARSLKPDVLHGHGAKAGAFVRLKGKSKKSIRVYTPHGGSLHYPPGTLKGGAYARMERALMGRTELFLFESAFARDTYLRVIGKPAGLVRCVFNGVTASEFDPVPVAEDATDLVYVGEFRKIKGADLLIEAVARLRADGKPITLTLAGDGKLLVVPSRGDSMPYVVIEAAAAGIPMVAASVGGIPEILGPHTSGLFVANSIGAIADAIEMALGDMDATRERARNLRERIFVHFSQKAMVDGVISGYRDAFNAR